MLAAVGLLLNISRPGAARALQVRSQAAATA